MRKLAFLFLIISFSSLTCIRAKRDSHNVTIIHQTESKGFPYLISNGKLGTISIGDGIDSTLMNLKIWFTILNDSMPSCEGCTTYTPVFHVCSKDSNLSIFSIEPGWEENNKDKVHRIMTSCVMFQTDKSIKVGMTIKNLKKVYEILGVDAGGETGLHLIIKDFKGSFGVEILNDDNWWFYKPSTIPDSLKITEIIIT